jgi:hypothetical protein
LRTDAKGRFGFWIISGQYSYSVQNMNGVNVGNYPLTLYQGAPGNSVVVAPSGAQTIVQPGTTGFFLNTLNTAFYASQYPGADVGAKINAADAAAGVGPADILVTATGNVSTAPTISSNHRLILAAPLTWTVGPILNSNTQIVGTGSNAVQTINSMGVWVAARGLSNLEINNLWVTNASTPVAEGATILGCAPCTNVVMNHNHAVKIGIFSSGTATAYGSISTADLTTNVHLEGNFVNGGETTLVGSARVITLANLTYPQHVTMVGNDIFQGEYNVEWWGGNAAVEGLDLTNPRWATDINITGGRSVNVQAGWWGSMGKNITVTGVNADTCLDTCLDAESSTNVVFSGFTVHNSGNGGLEVFFGSVNNEFGPGIVTSDTAAFTPMFLRNSGGDANGATGVKVHNVKFICSDATTLCDLRVDPIGSFQFNDNELINSTLSLTQTGNSGYEISRNSFHYTHTPAAVFSAIRVPGQVKNYMFDSTIAGNVFQSDTAQVAGTYAINATITDFNFADALFVRSNTTEGFTNDARFVANSANSFISPRFIFNDNAWGNNSVAQVISGTLGSFIGSLYDVTTNTTTLGKLSVGGVTSNTGMQMVTDPGCTPPSTVLGMCTATITLPVAEIAPDFTILCNARGANVFIGSTKNETTTTFQVDIYATASTSVVVNHVACLVFHP